MSASWITAISPSIRAIAARIAAPLPAIAAVSSVEPSSTTTTCASRPSEAIRSSTSPIVAASLWAGTRKLTRTPLRRRAPRPHVEHDREHEPGDHPDQAADEGRVPPRACGRLEGRGALDRLGDLDVLRERELLLGRGQLVVQVPLAGDRGVELRDEDQLR